MHVRRKERPLDADHVADDLESVLLTEDQILTRVASLAQELGRDYAGREPVLIGRASCRERVYSNV